MWLRIIFFGLKEIMANIQAIRGMHDILPDQTPLWQYAEKTIRDVLGNYGYSEIRLPVVEKQNFSNAQSVK